jgi:hypothetical protein
MTAEQIVNRKVSILCRECQKTIKVVKARNVEWVRRNCLYVVAINEFVCCVESKLVCSECRQSDLFAMTQEVFSEE